ncbi:MAG: hypothetical protein K2O08_01910 [Clostridia bacterium]|nr:hypothetical protein [Clostridia bacterium]
MKKNARIIFIILLIFTVAFASVACDGSSDHKVTLTFDESSGAVSWYCKDADKYLLEIFEKGSDDPVLSQEFTSASDHSLNY